MREELELLSFSVWLFIHRGFSLCFKHLVWEADYCVYFWWEKFKSSRYYYTQLMMENFDILK